jgi:hypothetical protein
MLVMVEFGNCAVSIVKPDGIDIWNFVDPPPDAVAFPSRAKIISIAEPTRRYLAEFVNVLLPEVVVGV